MPNTFVCVHVILGQETLLLMLLLLNCFLKLNETQLLQ